MRGARFCGPGHYSVNQLAIEFLDALTRGAKTVKPAPILGLHCIGAFIPRGFSGLSQQHDVELLLAIAGLGMQGDGLADEVGKHGQGLGFFLVEEVDHIGRGQHPELTGIELAGFAQEFAKDFVGHRAGGLHLAPAATGGAGFAQQVGQGLPGALAGHLHQAQAGEAVHRHLGVILGQGFTKLFEHGVAMFGAFHVDEVDDDDAAQVAYAELAGNGLGCLQVGLEDGVVEIARTDEAAGVHCLVPRIEKMTGEKIYKEVSPEKLKAYTTTGGAPHLDGEYTVFGKVISGLEVIDKIAALPTQQERPVEDVRMTVTVEELPRKKITELYGYTYPNQ